MLGIDACAATSEPCVTLSEEPLQPHGWSASRKLAWPVLALLSAGSVWFVRSVTASGGPAPLELLGKRSAREQGMKAFLAEDFVYEFVYPWVGEERGIRGWSDGEFSFFAAGLTDPSSTRPLSFVADFQKTCHREFPELTRLWGSRPHPDLSMVSGNVLWRADDPNLRILPRWSSHGHELTMPFLDTHVAVRFLGGVSEFGAATAADCVDVQNSVWCDLVTRSAKNGSLLTRVDLLRSRLDR